MQILACYVHIVDDPHLQVRFSPAPSVVLCASKQQCRTAVHVNAFLVLYHGALNALVAIRTFPYRVMAQKCLSDENQLSLTLSACFPDLLLRMA
jgi:hypothetical protein